jgi:hypothetical protein
MSRLTKIAHTIEIVCVCFLIALSMLLYYSNGVVTDPDDQCQDTSINHAARYISCSLEGR